MIEVPDYIYERSVIKQLYLKEESRHLFQKNAYSVSINREDDRYYTEASDIFVFKAEMKLSEHNFNEIIRKIICAGGKLTELRVEAVFAGGFEEAWLREFSVSLKKIADRIGVDVKRMSVYLKEGAEPENIVFVLGSGPLKSASDAPWQRQRIFEGQSIVLTGSLGKSGMAELFKKNEAELDRVYPKIFVEKMRHKFSDRMPIIEAETAPFYRVSAMLPLGKGGLLAGLWNLGDRKEAGLAIYAERLSYEQETVEISNYFNINPLEMRSEGAYLLASDRGEELTQALRRAGIEAVCIGEVLKDKKRVVIFEDEERFIEPPKYEF